MSEAIMRSERPTTERSGVFTLTRRTYVEARVKSLISIHVSQYYDNEEEYNGTETRVDDLIFASEVEWDSLFTRDIQEVQYSV